MSNVEKLANDLRFLLHAAIYIFTAMTMTQLLFGIGVNDSDASSWTRSGLKLRTDHLTGCQYFEAPNGGLLMRLDATGKHICNAKGGAA